MNHGSKKLTRREFIILSAGSMAAFTLGNAKLLSAANRIISIQWFGQACFLITTSKGTKILTDPVLLFDYKIPKSLKPDIVTVSHEHMDHNRVDQVSGNPHVVRGLAEEGTKFNPIDKTIRDVRIYNVSSYHDKNKGNDRGLNSIFVFEFDGLRLAHLGDLGHVLTDKQVKEIGPGPVDMVMISVGGIYTIAEEDAHRVIRLLKPSLFVFPMHYKTKSAAFLAHTGDDFVSGLDNVKKVSGNRYRFNPDDLPEKVTYILIDYQ